MEWIKGFVFKQKCMPWRFYVIYARCRNYLFNVNTQRYWDMVWSNEKYKTRPNRFCPNAFNKIVQLVPHYSDVVDIGCGIGILLKTLRKENNCEVFGVDISKEAIDALKEQNIDGIVAKVPPIPLPPNHCDVAIATELLEHVNSPDCVLDEMVRIVKDGGFLILMVPDNTLSPDSEREHVSVFDSHSLKTLFIKNNKIRNIEIHKVKDENENINRLIAKGEVHKKGCSTDNKQENMTHKKCCLKNEN